jgi:hypothetical protein
LPTECWSEAWQTCLGINTSFLLALLALLVLLPACPLESFRHSFWIWQAACTAGWGEFVRALVQRANSCRATPHPLQVSGSSQKFCFDKFDKGWQMTYQEFTWVQGWCVCWNRCFRCLCARRNLWLGSKSTLTLSNFDNCPTLLPSSCIVILCHIVSYSYLAAFDTVLPLATGQMVLVQTRMWDPCRLWYQKWYIEIWQSDNMISSHLRSDTCKIVEYLM